MKNLFVMCTFALLSITLFSCTADEFDTTNKKTEAKRDVVRDSIQADVPPDGPGDDPVPVTPPKK